MTITNVTTKTNCDTISKLIMRLQSIQAYYGDDVAVELSTQDGGSYTAYEFEVTQSADGKTSLFIS